MQSQTRPLSEPDAPPSDYLVIGRDEPDPPRAGVRILHGLQILMVIVLALLSFAIFWVVGLLLDIF